MKPLIRAFGLFLVAMLAGLPASLWAQNQTAEQAVEQNVTELLDKVVEIRGLYDSDREEYFRQVSENLADFVDFREAARGVMAQYSQGPDGATSEQLDRFAEVFKQSMIDFYGSALAAYDGEKFELLPTPDNGRDNTADVRMNILSNDGSRIELQYSMYIAPDGNWKMRNIYVEGVNLRRQYHSRFDSMMSRYRDIDAVIDNWAATE